MSSFDTRSWCISFAENLSHSLGHQNGLAMSSINFTCHFKHKTLVLAEEDSTQLQLELKNSLCDFSRNYSIH